MPDGVQPVLSSELFAIDYLVLVPDFLERELLLRIRGQLMEQPGGALLLVEGLVQANSREVTRLNAELLGEALLDQVMDFNAWCELGLG